MDRSNHPAPRSDRVSPSTRSPSGSCRSLFPGRSLLPSRQPPQRAGTASHAHHGAVAARHPLHSPGRAGRVQAQAAPTSRWKRDEED